MIEEHLQSLRDGDYAAATISSATDWLRKFADFCGDRNPLELKESDLLAWHKALSWTPGVSGKLYSQCSINQAVGAVRRYYRWAIAEGLLKQSPTAKLVTPYAQRVLPPKLSYSPAQQRKLLTSPDLATPLGVRDRAILALLLETKISRKACARIDQSHLQFDTGALLTTGRTRQIHSLSQGLLADLEHYLQDSRPLLVRHVEPALFLTREGKRMTKGGIDRMLLVHRRRCGL